MCCRRILRNSQRENQHLENSRTFDQSSQSTGEADTWDAGRVRETNRWSVIRRSIPAKTAHSQAKYEQRNIIPQKRLSCAAEPWISRIPQRLANQIVAGDGDENGESGIRHLPGSLQQASAAFTENCAPGRCRNTDTQP